MWVSTGVVTRGCLSVQEWLSLANGRTYSRSPRCLYRRGFGARDCQTAFPVALTETIEGMCLLVAGHYKSRIQPPLQLLCLPRGVAAADH